MQQKRGDVCVTPFSAVCYMTECELLPEEREQREWCLSACRLLMDPTLNVLAGHSPPDPGDGGLAGDVGEGDIWGTSGGDGDDRLLDMATLDAGFS